MMSDIRKELVGISDELLGVELVLRDTALLMNHISNNDLSMIHIQAMTRSIQTNLEVYGDDLGNLIEFIGSLSKVNKNEPSNASNG